MINSDVNITIERSALVEILAQKIDVLIKEHGINPYEGFHSTSQLFRYSINRDAKLIGYGEYKSLIGLAKVFEIANQVWSRVDAINGIKQIWESASTAPGREKSA